MTRGLSALATNAWPIQALFFFWLEWGCCGPNPPLVLAQSALTLAQNASQCPTKVVFEYSFNILSNRLKPVLKTPSVGVCGTS